MRQKQRHHLVRQGRIGQVVVRIGERERRGRRGELVRVYVVAAPEGRAPFHDLCGNQNFYGTLGLNRRVDLDAIDATPARWRGDAGSSPLDGASTAASSPSTRFTSDFHTVHDAFEKPGTGGPFSQVDEETLAPRRERPRRVASFARVFGNRIVAFFVDADDLVEPTQLVQRPR